MEQGGQIRWHRLSSGEREALRDAAQEILVRLPWVIAAWHFGSSASGDRPARDVDVGILVSRLPDDLAVTDRLAAELAAVSGIEAIPFDVRILNEADPVFLGRFLQNAVLIHESDRRARIEWQALAMSMWLDFKPVWERIRKAAMERWVQKSDESTENAALETRE